jgi:hypothetical protein
MRRRLQLRCAIASVLCVAGMAMLTGCNEGAGARSKAGPSASPTRVPAAAAGGACLHFDYEVIEKVTGAEFDVAGKGENSGTSTCVLQKEGASLPDLTLAVTRTSADVNVFKTVVMPKGAAIVTELGRQGYSAMVAAGADAGPGVEVGWLSGNGRLMVLRYRLPTGTAPADPTAFAPKLVELAKRIDRATV